MLYCFFIREKTIIMENFTLVRLDLRAPLLYAEAPGLAPFNCPIPEGSQEFLFCFEIDADQAASIEPTADCFLGELVFSGRKNGGHGEKTLPAGLYLFAQRRNALCREEIINMALEKKKDGLWERLNPGKRLYLRLLSEDGSPVTQLFRPYT
jgi:hypothetical protein